MPIMDPFSLFMTERYLSKRNWTVSNTEFQIDLNIYRNDKDKMYTLFTEEEFIIFMLKREIIVDMRANPITVSKDEEWRFVTENTF